jgi:phenylalanyl-tRNA synthetase beta chain
VKTPLGWVRDYIDLDGVSAEEIVSKLASLGFPVESTERRPTLSGIVVGRIVELEKHPNADRLQVCTIDIGASSPLTIATAATNVAQGQFVPVAAVGARVFAPDAPGNLFTITARKMRGVESQGMLCSAAELGLEATWFEDGILQLEPEISPGTDVIAHYRLNDEVLDVEITSNRVDVMSMLGIARELGAAYDKPVRDPVPYARIAESSPTQASCGDMRVILESVDCRRFVAQRFSAVVVKPAPAWMRIRLALAGQRPISNFVDISNFVMMELGQPQHFYDFEKLAGGCLLVRDAHEGEHLRTLDGEEHALTSLALVIADEREAQGLAGLKGGALSEISASTREIVLESASFVGARIRRMSAQQGFRTDASSRHEKTLPLELADAAAARAATLVIQQGAKAHQAFSVGMEATQREEIDVSASDIRRLLGIDVPPAEVQRVLRALDFDVRTERNAAHETTYFARAPYRRGDVTIAADVVEEIARIIGYDRIEAHMPPVLDHEIPSAAYEREDAVADALAALGYHEINSLALQPASTRETFERAGITLPKAVEIANPLSEDQRFLRFSLLPGLLDLTARSRRDCPLRLFEIGHVFESAQPDPLEIAMVAWLLFLPKADEPAWRDGGFLEHKGDTLACIRAITGMQGDAVIGALPGLHPGKTASLVVNGKGIATIGAIDPRLLAAYKIEGRAYCGFARMEEFPERRVPTFQAPSRFPAVERDLSLILSPEISAHDIAHAIRAGVNGVLRDVRVFDEYRGPQIGENRKSIAVRVKLQRDDATLTDAEADAHIASILASLHQRVGAEIRS